MNWALMGAAALVGYLCGSISFARIIVKAHGHDAVEAVALTSPDGGAQMTSDAVSATAVRLMLGAKWGLLCAAGDILKATIPTLVFRFAFPASPTCTRRGSWRSSGTTSLSTTASRAVGASRRCSVRCSRSLR